MLARWPGSGARHATACDHYEAPDYLTGMGQVRGSAVLDDETSGETSLKLGFPLSRGAARLAPAALTNDKPTVKSSGQKLSMRGLLHVLWDRAELTHWHPKMAGKRTWFVVRRALLEAAASCRAKQEALSHVLFVPESFRQEEKEEIRARRRAALARVYASRDEMMVVVGEIKEIVAAHGAERIVLRHVGDMPFVMDQDMARRFHKRFAGELALWQAQDGPNGKSGHLILGGSFARRREGTFDLIEVALMPVTAEWLPYETSDERYLVGKAVAEKRRFMKGLRVNLDLDTPIASLVLKDTGEEASAIHIHDRDDEVAEPLEALLAGQGVAHLLWKEGEPLPARVSRAPRRNWDAQQAA
ncbi:hypothetical protein FHS51_002976 [Sphingobium wenxiniae]|uniref:Uncharacterized protein DUF1173 n=2 Tax=Sphingomonadaceae TaxID=41297 RepID=A0A562KA68_SPHWJ|nr:MULTISPECIES: DUF1173 family protein [Sphingomonadaceae]SCW93815.1 Protein of unknown function [Sphingobium faniae]MBB6192723.1 hypothetical protein [Sphingobium wenxiniae]TWH92174.1 uncharacterized protein DUF1173 [Sphingobium wenxiniae]BAF03396.1 hypothetical protein [Novosphingobium sp. KA1]GEO01905.1 hypothetical protein NSE01_37370 [Novosphingobium sediminis]